MRLYCTPGGTWAGTEANWKAAVKAEGLDPKTIERRQVEVPTAKAELLEFLTFHGVNPIGGRLVTAAAPAPAPVIPATVGELQQRVQQDLDSLWYGAPLGHRLDLASTVFEDAHKALYPDDPFNKHRRR